MYIPDNLENGWIKKPKCTQFSSERGQSDPLWPQNLVTLVWKDAYGTTNDLDDAREFSTFWTFFRENHSDVIGNKHQTHYIMMLPKI